MKKINHFVSCKLCSNNNYKLLVKQCAHMYKTQTKYVLLGADRFLEDVKVMLTDYPYPRLFWKCVWKYACPVIIGVRSLINKFIFDNFYIFYISYVCHI